MEKMQKLRTRPLSRRSRKQRNILLGIVAVAGTGYGLYRLYRSPSIARKRYQLLRFLTSMGIIAEAAAASAETVKLVSNDLKIFLQSDSDEIPTTIKQLLKAARSPEFRQTLTGVSSSVTSGLIQGLNPPESDRNPDSPGVAERLMEKILTPAGTGFVSAVVGSFARNLVLGFFENSANFGAGNGEGSNSRPPGGELGIVDVICSEKGRALVGECIQQFVSTAVSIYLDKTIDINTYDLICAALVNPERHAQMKGFLISVCNGAVETLVRTSHEVLTNGSSSSTKDGMIKIKPESQYLKEGGVNSENLEEKLEEKDQKFFPNLRLFQPSSAQKMHLSNGIDREKIIVETHSLNSGFAYHSWIDKISYTLAIPSNRRLFIELSGKMTFEAVRSFFEFLLWKASDFFTRTVPEVSYEAVDKVLNVMRYVGAKTIVIATLCLAICLHVLSGVRVLEAMQ